MFIEQLFRGGDNTAYYLAVVMTMIISITLHELAHGIVAMKLGDDTPLYSGHMTGNPLVHMGPISLACVFLAGFGWGAMPVDPTRMRGRYADSLVSLAGPATNFALCLLSLTTLGLLLRFDALPASHVGTNLSLLLFVFGAYNLVLAVFNLIPLPPMDGSRILADVNRGYRDFISREDVRGAAAAAFMVLFLFGGRFLFPPLLRTSTAYVTFVAGG